MYCIAVLAVNEKEGQDYAKYIIDYCTERSIFPLVELEFNQWKDTSLSTVINNIFCIILSFFFIDSQHSNTVHQTPPFFC